MIDALPPAPYRAFVVIPPHFCRVTWHKPDGVITAAAIAPAVYRAHFRPGVDFETTSVVAALDWLHAQRKLAAALTDLFD